MAKKRTTRMFYGKREQRLEALADRIATETGDVDTAEQYRSQLRRNLENKCKRWENDGSFFGRSKHQKRVSCP